MITDIFGTALARMIGTPPPPPPVIVLPERPRTVTRSYAGASMDQLSGGLQDSINTSSDTEIMQALRVLRARSRELCRNNDYAKNAVRHLSINVIGTGVKMHPAIKTPAGELDKPLNDTIHKAWEQWMDADSCDVSGLLHLHDMEALIVKSLVENGEVLIRLHRAPFGDSRIPLGLQLIEADQLLDNWQTGRAENGNMIKMGVEIDRYNRPVAYWLYPVHPGDYLFQTYSPSAFIRVQAADIIHLYIPDRIGQSRGVPWMHTTIMRMKHIGGYEEAEIVRARASANVMGIIKSPEAPTPELIENNLRQEYMNPGEIKHLLPGEEWDFANPSAPNPNAAPFVRLMLRGAMAGIGISYASGTGDYSDTNYSSSRLGQYSERDFFRVIQGFYIRRVRQRIHREFMTAAVLSGTVQIPGFYRDQRRYDTAQFRARGWGWTSPKDDVPAYKEARRAGFMTTAQIIAETSGASVEIGELYAHMAEENDLAEAHNLVLDSNPAQIDAQGKRQLELEPMDTPNPRTAGNPDAD